LGGCLNNFGAGEDRGDIYITLFFTLVLLRNPHTYSYPLQIDSEFVVKNHPIFILSYNKN
jgi:hypothetical protein